MIAETLINKASNLQAPSPTLVRLLTLLNHPNADYDEVISTVARDAVLSAKLLALCNSASYGLAQPVASLEQGVLILGYGEIHRLVMALSFGGQIGADLPGYDMEAGALWRHSLVTALLTPRIAGMSSKVCADNSIAYTAGLLHDIGKLVISQAMDGPTRGVIQKRVEQEGEALLQAERAVIGCDHAEVGAGLLRNWRIPEVIVEAVANHHAPGNQNPQLSAIVHVADAIAHQTGASPGWSSLAIFIDEGAVAALNLTALDVENLTFAAFDAQEKVSNQEGPGAKRTKPIRMGDVADCAL